MNALNDIQNMAELLASLPDEQRVELMAQANDFKLKKEMEQNPGFIDEIRELAENLKIIQDNLPTETQELVLKKILQKMEAMQDESRNMSITMKIRA